MSRTVTEWIAKTADTKVPPRVRLRVFLRHGGKCHLSGRVIRPGDAWDLDHIVALTNGGVHAETNLAPALRDKHREKTAVDVAEKSRTYRKAAAHAGVKLRAGPKIKSAGFNKQEPQRSASRPLKKRAALALTSAEGAS
jgi:5-methylcytosine-specific restriction protein A